MLLTKAGENLLVCFMVGFESDGGIFLHQAEKARRHLLLLALLRHLDRHAQARLREGDRGELQHLFRAAQRVARAHIRELCHNADITRRDLRTIILLRAAHGDNLAHAFALLRARIIGGNVRRNFTGYNFKEGHLAHKWVGNCFKADGGKRAVRIAGELHRIPIRILRRLTRAFIGARRDLRQAVKQLVNALRCVAGAGKHGVNRAVRHAVLQAADDLLLRKLCAVEKFLHQLVIRRGDRFLEKINHLRNARILRNRHFGCLTILICKRFLRHEVDICLDHAALHIGHDDRAQLRFMDFLEKVKRFIKIGILGIHLGDCKHLRNPTRVRRFESLFRTYVVFAAGGRGNQHAIRCPDAFAYSACKIEQAGRVDKVHLNPIPFQRRDCRRNRGFALFFFSVVVEHGIPVCNATEALCCPRQVKHRLGERRLTPSAMAGDRNISDILCMIGFQTNFLLHARPAGRSIFCYSKPIIFFRCHREL